MGLSVCSFMGGQRGDIISGIFKAGPECPKDLPLSILAQRLNKELSLRKPASTEEKDAGRQSGVKLQSKGSVS